MAGIDLAGIKTAIKTILDGANNVSGSPIDLSYAMQSRVQKIVRLNPSRIPVQPSFYPCVSMFFEGKSVRLLDIAVNMLIGKRQSKINMKVVGIVWVDTMSAGFETQDLADNECEQLMENIEHVLRGSPTLDGTVLWAAPTAVTYHEFKNEEGAHLRAGIMNLELTLQY